MSGADGVTDISDSLIGCAEIGIGAKHRVIEKTGASVSTNAPVIDDRLHKLPINTAARVVDKLIAMI